MILIKRIKMDPAIFAKTQAICQEIKDYLEARARAEAAAPPPDPAQPPPKKKPKDGKLAKLVAKYGDDSLGLKKHLSQECAGKCAYCESRVLHVAYGDIEHVIPKSLRPDIAVDVENLTLACGICNNNKSDYYDEKAPLLDPNDPAHDPRLELSFAGWGIAESRCKGRGKNTLHELELNRPWLMQQREKKFNELGELISSYEKETDDIEKHALWRTIWSYAEPEAEYSSMCRTEIDWCKVETEP